MKKVAKIENWGIMSDAGIYTSPELINFQLRGEVYGHYRIEDGKEIRTSTIEKIDYEKRIVETQHTIYQLGKPNEEWLKIASDEIKRKLGV